MNGRLAIWNDESVIVIPVAEHQTSVTKRTFETVWSDVTQGGNTVYQLSNGRTVLADRVRITEDIVEVPRKQRRIPKVVKPEDSVAEELEDAESDDLPDELPELTLPSFSALVDDPEDSEKESEEEDSQKELNFPTGEETGSFAL
jgi:hypothetical protein